MARLPLVILLTLAASCGGGSDDPVDAGFNCELDPRDEEFLAGMEKVGDNGMTFRLVSSDPAPPARNDNVWVIEIEDGDGPLAGATVDLKVFMPDHGHGSPVPEVVTEDPEVAGRYTADPVNLFMPGIWEITIEATPAGGTAVDADEAVFVFCVGS